VHLDTLTAANPNPTLVMVTSHAKTWHLTVVSGALWSFLELHRHQGHSVMPLTAYEDVPSAAK